ncbi:MAG: DsbC family protein [Pseudomonadota bacterium]
MGVGIVMTMLITTAGFAESIPDAVKKRIAELEPTLGPAEVRPSPMTGLYEVILGPQVVYLSADGRYLIQGELMDIRTKRNLTRESRSVARKGIAKGFDERYLVIYEPKTNVRHTVTVFTDVDCPYCSRFHREVPQLLESGVRVRYAAFPRGGIPSANYDRMVAVWCAEDPLVAMTEAKEGRRVPPARCDNRVREHLNTARAMGVRGTPTMLFSDGELVPGYVPWRRLVRMLDDNNADG